MIQAIVGMWRKVGIDAEIEVYEIAKHYELRAGHKLAPMAFYNWGNAIGDPTTSTGFAMFSPSPHSAWKSKDLDDMIGPLWGEKDEAKRIAGWKAVDKYIAEKGYVIPLVQYSQPIVFKSSLKVTPNGDRRAAADAGRQGLMTGKGRADGEVRPRAPFRPPASSAHDYDAGRRPPPRHGRDHACWASRSIVFVLLRVVPGDPIAMMISPGASPADIAALRAHYGLDAGIADAVRRLGAGSRCTAISARRSRCIATCSRLLAERLPATLELAVAALVFAVAARRRGRGVRDADRAIPRRRRSIDAVNGLFLAVPDFIWAFALVLLFGVFAAGAAAVGPHRSQPRRAFRDAVLSARKPRSRCASRAVGDVMRAYDHADAGARPAARRGHHARPQGIAARGDGAGLCAARAAEGHVAAAARAAGGAAQRGRADAGADRRAVHLPDRRHGDRRAHLRLSRHRQHGGRRRDQSRPAADPGPDAGRSARCSSSST